MGGVGRHRRGPGFGARHHDPVRRRRGPAARPGRAQRPRGAVPGVPRPHGRRGRGAGRARRGRCRAPARGGPGGAARLGMAAPAQPARRQFRGDPDARHEIRRPDRLPATPRGRGNHPPRSAAYGPGGRRAQDPADDPRTGALSAFQHRADPPRASSRGPGREHGL